MKRQKMRIGLSLLISLAIVVTGCRKDKEVITKNHTIGPEPAVYINSSISGVVIDVDGNPIERAFVAIDNYSTETDDNGFFYLKDVLANKNGTSLRASKGGYFPNTKLVYPLLNRVTFVEIIMTASEKEGGFQVKNGGDVGVPAPSTSAMGASITFPPDAITLDNVLYDGEVSVHAVYFDPTGQDILQRMPGSLLGVNNEGSLVGMKTFGMLGVELFGENGEPLEMAPGKTATMEMPIPTDILGEAPQEIALWHFDITSGYWIQEGSATLNGNVYVAEVSHFSFWNCDVPFDLVNAVGRLVGGSGEPLIGSEVKLTFINSAVRNTGYAKTGPAGYFSGKIPANEDLLLEVFDPCGTLVHSEPVGPFSSDADLGEIVISNGKFLTAKGNLVNCDLEPVTNGYAKISIGGSSTYAVVDNGGYFDIGVNYCKEAAVSVIGYDLDQLESSRELTYNFSNDIQMGQIQACGVQLNTMVITIDGITTTLEYCFVSDSVAGSSNLNIYAEGTGGVVSMSIGGNAVGTFDVFSFGANLNRSPNAEYIDPEMTCTLTKIDPAPSIAIGDFGGMVFDNAQGKTVEVSGHFRAQRN